MEVELARLGSLVTSKDEEIGELRTRNELMDATLEEKIQEEKDRIVHILEAAFCERKKLAESQLETSLKALHDKEIERVVLSKNEEMHNR